MSTYTPFINWSYLITLAFYNRTVSLSHLTSSCRHHAASPLKRTMFSYLHTHHDFLTPKNESSISSNKQLIFEQLSGKKKSFLVSVLYCNTKLSGLKQNYAGWLGHAGQGGSPDAGEGSRALGRASTHVAQSRCCSSSGSSARAADQSTCVRDLSLWSGFLTLGLPSSGRECRKSKCDEREEA